MFKFHTDKLKRSAGPAFFCRHIYDEIADLEQLPLPSEAATGNQKMLVLAPAVFQRKIGLVSV